MQPEEKKIILYNKLVQGCLKNDRISQRKLYDLLSSKFFGMCLRYAKNVRTAEDMLQEGFVKIFKYLHKYSGKGSFEGWARRIMVNTAIEIYRKESKLFPLVNYEDQIYEPKFVYDSDHLEYEDLLNHVQKLSTGYRTVFNLFVIEGYSHKEIAGLLSISEGTSKSQLARARNLLQKMITEENRPIEENGVVAK